MRVCFFTFMAVYFAGSRAENAEYDTDYRTTRYISLLFISLCILANKLHNSLIIQSIERLHQSLRGLYTAIHPLPLFVFEAT